MNLLSLEIPEDPADHAGWLERHLVGPDLAQVMTELTALQGGREVSGAHGLQEVLGRWLPQVLKEGLGVLPPENLRQLLLSPRLFPELQEWILVQGGPYWDRVTATGPLEALIERGEERLNGYLHGQAKSAEPDQPSAAVPQTLPFPGKARWYRQPWAASLATAASMLLGMFLYQLWQTSPTAAPAWGWSKPGALPANASAGEYLNALAEGAGEWFNKRPADAAALAQRLGDFRQGCSMLIFAEHHQLTPADRAWLVEKCQAWGAKLDQHRAALESGADLEEVRRQADGTVTNIMAALRSRAMEA